VAFNTQNLVPFLPVVSLVLVVGPFYVVYRCGWPADARRRAAAGASFKFFASLLIIWLLVGTIALTR